MREHMGLFRGKRTDGKGWIEGSLWMYLGKPSILGNANSVGYTVDPDTVGECTGLTDKNGKLIFEGDVVRMPHEYTTTEKIKGYYGYDSEGYPQRIPGYTGSGEYPTVKRGFKNCPVKFKPSRGFYAEGTSFFLSGIDVEVIGNVVDNPELLKGGEG